MGLAIVRDGDTAESIMARADEALYASKRAGRNQLQCSSDEAPTTEATAPEPETALPVAHEDAIAAVAATEETVECDAVTA